MIETRFDFVFSYWIFLWYIFYELNIVKYNPKIAIIIAILINIVEICIMFYFLKSLQNITLYMILFFLIKIVPLWTLRKSSYKIVDFYAFILLFIIYISWLLFNNINITQAVIDTEKRIEKNQPIGPFTYYVDLLLR
jgi:hypothetical protein